MWKFNYMHKVWTFSHVSKKEMTIFFLKRNVPGKDFEGGFTVLDVSVTSNISGKDEV